MTFVEIQRRISEFVEKDATTADYLDIEKKLDKIEGKIPSYVRHIRLAFLSSFTLQGLPKVVRIRGVFHNLFVETYCAPYNRFAQEIIDGNSGLFSFRPDCVFLLVDGRDIFDEGARILEDFLRTLKIRVKNIDAKIVMANFIPSTALDYVKTKSLNDLLNTEFSNHRRFQIFDFVSFLDRIGKEKNWCTKYMELGDLRLAPSAFPAFAEELLGYAVAVGGNTRKCIVADLDNTLWSGIVGEDGPDRIVPDRAIQKQLHDFRNEGIVLAINSTNNKDDVNSAFSHKDMLLGMEDFAASKINWERKDFNLEDLAEDLKLGTDSFVFIDDDPLQRNLIRGVFPEVAVLPPSLIYSFKGFRRWYATEEDKRRSIMYTEERKRNEFRRSFAKVEDYLRTLQLAIRVREADKSVISRVSQLTQKTNQFNLTTRRYSEENILCFINLGWRIWIMDMQDIFGDYGITGICMVEPHDSYWRVDNFLLSCRVLGRGVEQAFLGKIIEEAKRAGVVRIVSEFIPTAQNKPCETFLCDMGFSLNKQGDSSNFYEFDTRNEYRIPDFIKIT